MWAKRIMAALLASVLVCGALSGCGNTLVEHRFSAGAWGSAAEAAVPDVAQAIRELENLLAEHGLKLYAGIQELKQPAAPGGNTADQVISGQKLAAWAGNPHSTLYLYTKAEGDPGVAEQLLLWKEQIRAYTQALGALDGAGWAGLEQRAGGALYLTGRVTARSGQVYLESALTARG